MDFFGWFKDGPDVFLAMEYMPLGDLEKNVVKCSGTVPEAEAKDITEQILSALNIMHAESFAHRDLKPQVRTIMAALFRKTTSFTDFTCAQEYLSS